MLRFDVITLFPDMFQAVSEAGVSRRAQQMGLWSLTCWNPRTYADNAYGAVDDRPFGGGPGMVMQAPPLAQAIAAARQTRHAAHAAGPVIYVSPQGCPLTQARVATLAKGTGAILLCGRYEGVDERVLTHAVDEEISLGDFVLSGGEIAALAIIDACVRLLPGALGDANSALYESFTDGILDWPQYTRPDIFEGMAVPEVLLSGHHERIRRWRLQQALGRTWLRRPELLARRSLSREETQLLAAFQADYAAAS